MVFSTSALGIFKSSRSAFPKISPKLFRTSFSNYVNPLPQKTFIPTIPQPPGYIVGTVNDAYIPPPADPFEGSRHWTIERLLGIGLVPLTIAPFATGSLSPIADSILSIILLVHCHAGFTSCIIDYIPRRVYGKLHYTALRLLSLGSLVSLVGIYEMEVHDIGFTSIFMKLWFP
ncbi:CybS family protein [Ascoidea rubescens DSM 1968]|uniref:Succinate dehydrogenase [ubiquinone] cytochrome b small subunit n=1 Tax=Ascoidea rubescens DSM 1968 TaxID=1344418 RepID=A0A1D2VJY1_9ASCO|nr:membrane anchor subunit of succinate dehydrogenase [Ascoidea rubescens DSM 1968]ODV61931.1 membrane anchor subunit of succinate dehydrogenase [Ascoidea rubescens DSM 1968]